jgi:cation diffusion facilitator CzcD-associated flavoprotein CzcO
MTADPTPTVTEVEVIVVGSGFSGLAMAVMLRDAGIDDFVVLEKAGTVGGTWRENTYPGAACDIPSHLYSFSFAPNPGWTRAYSPQGEILAYLERVADETGVRAKIRFHAEVTEARWDAAGGRWDVVCGDGTRLRARSLVLGNGALHVPAYPDIPGLDRFAGPCFHSARWDHAVDLTGKRVAVVGTGASAVQFVPEIAPKVARLVLFQRTPAWIVPKADRPIGARTRRLLRRLPALQWLIRAGLYWQHEVRAFAFTRARVMRLLEPLARRFLAQSVADPALRAALTPNYRMGCKRILPSNEFYPAVQRSNVELVTEPIAEVTETGVRTRDGRLREVDAILLGTGFRVSEYLSKIRVFGADGRELNDLWRGVPATYLGITVAGFPNLFLLMGPNTGLGHNSMIFMIEAQARYAVQGIRALRERGLRSLDVRPDVQDAFFRELQRRVVGTVWSSGCASWYAPGGHNAAIWPGYTVDYWRRTRRLDLDDYRTEPA